MVKLVIFDWDGTLFDSIDRICDSMLEAAKQAKAPARQHEDIQNIIGLSLDEAIATVWPELSSLERDTIKFCYKAIYVKADQSPPKAYDGVFDLLNKLSEHSIKMSVATGKTRRGLDRAMALSNTSHYFVASRSADEAFSKPHPLMLKQILEELNVSPEHVIMVGDTEYDLNMARAAGIAGIGVSYGAHDEARLRACKPEAIISNIYELTSILGITA